MGKFVLSTCLSSFLSDSIISKKINRSAFSFASMFYSPTEEHIFFHFIYAISKKVLQLSTIVQSRTPWRQSVLIRNAWKYLWGNIFCLTLVFYRLEVVGLVYVSIFPRGWIANNESSTPCQNTPKYSNVSRMTCKIFFEVIEASSILCQYQRSRIEIIWGIGL